MFKQELHYFGGSPSDMADMVYVWDGERQIKIDNPEPKPKDIHFDEL